jgi:hypothetical protein
MRICFPVFFEIEYITKTTTRTTPLKHIYFEKKTIITPTKLLLHNLIQKYFTLNKGCLDIFDYKTS